MSEFDDQLKQLLSAEDEQFVSESLIEPAHFKEFYGSLKGKGKGNFILGFTGVLLMSALMFFAMWKFFHVDTTRDQILFATLTLMAFGGGTTVKLWMNMYMARRAIIREIKRLQLAVVHADNN